MCWELICINYILVVDGIGWFLVASIILAAQFPGANVSDVKVTRHSFSFLRTFFRCTLHFIQYESQSQS